MYWDKTVACALCGRPVRAYKETGFSEVVLDTTCSHARIEDTFVGRVKTQTIKFDTGTQEYSRRNHLVAKAIGANANAKVALAKLKTQKRPPRWLVESLEGIIDRTEPLSKALAEYRDLERHTVE